VGVGESVRHLSMLAPPIVASRKDEAIAPSADESCCGVKAVIHLASAGYGG
jgi:hypothetical protein